MSILDWFIKTKSTLSEFLAFCIGFVAAIFLPNILNLARTEIIVAIILIFIFMRGLEWVLAKILGDRDRKLSKNNYFVMAIIFPVLAIFSYILFGT
ncbi:hypothetical protein ACUXCC_004135 [Cytobacillus horneckiae]|uniref:Uncharacterized protein n=1 Tax=Cytobacillus horneckiae TaxID=549687 RepID=A0A2N0ZHS2_9BACI|nr:hypothetical protein [Cytobacillus horneckiae]NRG47890.1 hypothetical protein [Bacillus sp. CRN 9]MBN6886967.1 hypothetical protein [Cytobacillus horneckiae]MCM3177563.1 hypothetical protein [Cytobacillus horneckiae]MEC1157866.1 hypothetical protein [Cytobacillus horneckiae]MED2937209.1 hypothetical protein [Cytobacillus horneckiae]